MVRCIMTGTFGPSCGELLWNREPAGDAYQACCRSLDSPSKMLYQDIRMD